MHHNTYYQKLKLKTPELKRFYHDTFDHALQYNSLRVLEMTLGMNTNSLVHTNFEKHAFSGVNEKTQWGGG